MINHCCLCRKDGESVDHQLLHSEVARALWHAIFNLFGLHWVIPSKVEELFACWWMRGHSRSAVVWKMIPLCLTWCLWGERNARCFEDSTRTLEELTHFFSLHYSLGHLLD